MSELPPSTAPAPAATPAAPAAEDSPREQARQATERARQYGVTPESLKKAVDEGSPPAAADQGGAAKKLPE